MIILGAFLIASLASFTAGLLGSGSGLIAIPLLSKLLYYSGIPAANSMHVAIGTVFTFCIILMSTAVITQHKHNTIDWVLFKRTFYPANLGVIVGSIISTQLDGHKLHFIFGVFVLCVGIWGLIRRKATPTYWSINNRYFLISNFFVNLTVGLSGMGLLLIPYLRKYGVPVITSIANVQAMGILSSLLGSIIYLLMGLNNHNLPSSCIGYINWELLPPLTLGSIIFARYGVKVARYIPQNILSLIFTLFMILVGLYMVMVSFYINL